MLKGKNILIGITGGIAAYKICELVRMYKRANADVKVIVTDSALNFVTPLTLQTLSQNEVYHKQFEIENLSPEHISLTQWADIFVVAPLSANTLSKLATGICDNLLTSVFCAFQKDVILCPAMNTGMWENSFIQENIKKLSAKYNILEPEDGFLACGTNGKGRLVENQKIFDLTCEILNKKKIFENKKIVITAGGTIEDIDPVRYISNYSSGKMGYALACEAKKYGAEVILITTKDFYGQFNTVKVKTACEMQQAIDKEFENTDILIMAAAVADYRVKNSSGQKIKKTNEDELTLTLVKNPDILQEFSNKKKNHQIVVGFCAETQNLLENAKNKIQKKGCDFIVANDVSRTDTGFSSDYNEVVIMDKNLNSEKVEKTTKNCVAQKILEFIWQKSVK